MLLSQQQLEGASLRTIAEVAVQHHFGRGYGPWAMSDVESYMHAQQRRTLAGILNQKFGKDAMLVAYASTVAVAAAACVLLCIYLPWSRAALLLTTIVVFVAVVSLGWRSAYLRLSAAEWNTNAVNLADGTYLRDYTHHKLPAQIGDVFATLKVMEEKDIWFGVSFIGRDPILWVSDRYERVAVVVWDELPDGRIAIVPPPHT
ncbi:MAG: hypothetical protein KA066_00785 [Candidatus Pacebacteria bacterium]|nr:hypothetical protein [Candidatus Paceibacterota bacterium]